MRECSFFERRKAGRVQRWLFIPDHEQAESDTDTGDVQKDWDRQEEPGLPDQDEKRGNVYGVANPAIRAYRNESPQSVPRSWCAAADGREDPKAPDVQRPTEGDDGDCVPCRGFSDSCRCGSGCTRVHTRRLRPAR
jgi:hypothetical protein